MIDVEDLLQSMLDDIEDQPDVRYINKMRVPTTYISYSIQMTDGPDGDQPCIYNSTDGKYMQFYVNNSKTGGLGLGSYEMVGLQVAPYSTKKFHVAEVVLRHFVGPPPT